MADSTAPRPQTTDLTYPQAFQLAQQLHRRSQLDQAESLYHKLIEAMPTDPNPVHYLGVLRHQRGRSEEGIVLIRRSLAMDETVASWHNNLGNVLLDTGQVDAAAAAYSRCTELDPENVEVLNNLGVMMRNWARNEEAEKLFERALAKSPLFASAHINLATLYYQQRRIKEGHEHITAVLEQDPGDPAACKLLGLLYASLGRLDEAAKIFREWLEHEPGSEQAKHHLAACAREAMPERATEGYVEEVFDSFAGSFEAKLASLEYRAPRLVGEAVEQRLGTPEKRWRILDAGCGTGLCAPYLAPYAAVLAGVDLSGNMLERAQSRGQYHQLVKADLVAYLETNDANWDLIVSADTLCYFGRLDLVMGAARRALRAAGGFIFTVEAHEHETDYQLNPHGRYSHRENYIRRILNEAGFTTIKTTRQALRNEAGKPVEGWLVEVN